MFGYCVLIIRNEIYNYKHYNISNISRILHKQLQQQLDSKAKATFDRLLINTLQSLSGILHHHIVKLPDPLKAKKEHEWLVFVSLKSKD